jgi:DNA-binding transcriptional regulator Cro
MKYAAALKFYKTPRAMAQAAGVTRQAVNLWKKSGVVPEISAWRLNRHSGGRLKFNLMDYAKPPEPSTRPA